MNIFYVVKKVLKFLAITSIVLGVVVAIVAGFYYLDAKIDYLANIIQNNQIKDMEDKSNFLNNEFTIEGNVQDLTRIVKDLKEELVTYKEANNFDYQKAENSVVQVMDDLGAGSGTVIKKSSKAMYILTCHHVVDGAIDFEEKYGIKSAVTVQYFKEGADVSAVSGAVIYKGYVEKYDKKVDLAIIRVDSLDDQLNVTTIAKEDPNIGDTIINIGNPLGAYRYVSKGILSDKTYTKNYYSVDALLTYGNSGGAAFNIRGELVGVPGLVPTYFLGIPESNMGLFISTPTVREFTKSLFEPEEERV
jgi:S1-C subfamily serine protease